MSKADSHTRERLSGLSDGIYAIAMTLLVLNIEPPDLPKLQVTNSVLLNHLLSIRTVLIVYGIAFMLLGQFWILSVRHLSAMVSTNRRHTWLTLVGLMFVCLMPFSTELIGKYDHISSAAIILHLNIVLVSLTLYLSNRHVARSPELLHEGVELSSVHQNGITSICLTLSAFLAVAISFIRADLSPLAYATYPIFQQVITRWHASKQDALPSSGTKQK